MAKKQTKRRVWVVDILFREMQPKEMAQILSILLIPKYECLDKFYPKYSLN